MRAGRAAGQVSVGVPGLAACLAGAEVGGVVPVEGVLLACLHVPVIVDAGGVLNQVL